ncbi:MAG: type IV secretory system conjugative DNA transfer family protein, partial [Verrucomicrobiales bacterium]|nr:type IV secretory system conjugative DNA transfer family protein [Verrucomicrobiales bacterium]
MQLKTKKKDPSRIQLGWESKSQPHSQVGFNPGHTHKVDDENIDQRPEPWELEEPESHLLTIAPTGSGKGRSAIIPTCLEWPGSLVVIDPKGEAAAVTARKRKALGNEVVMIDPFGIVTKNPSTFNPFDILPFTDLGVEEFSLMFPGLLHPDRDYSQTREPFWDLRGDELIAGATAYMMSVLPEEERTITTLRKLLKSGDVIYELAVVLDKYGKEMPPMAYENLSSFISTEDKCRSGILATAQQHFAIYADPLVEKSLGSTSFDIGDFRDGSPMTIYLILPTNRLNSHQALLRIWMSSIISLLKSRTSRPEIATLLMIDEAAQMGRMSALLECVTLLRGYGVRTWTFWQSKNQ